jgi:hypothetical protein
MRVFKKIALLAMFIAPMLATTRLSALPNFARKYGYECSMCHTTISRLNRFGYEFRAAGFRIPSEIGEYQKATWEGTVTASVRATYAYTGSSTYKDFTPVAPGTIPVETKAHSSQLTGASATFWPFLASFGKHYYAAAQIGLTNGNPVSVSNAYLGFVWGHEENFFNLKVGLFNSREGYGGSNAYVGPLAGSSSANNSGAMNSLGVATSRTTSTLGNASVSGEGVGLGWHHGNTSVEAMVFNGNSMSADGKTLVTASGGANTKIAGQWTQNSKDFALFFNQIIKKDGTGISASYYRGKITLPNNMVAPAATQTKANSFVDDYYRAGIYGAWLFVPKFGMQAGYIFGSDNSWNPTTLNGTDKFENKGWFLTAYFPVHEKLTVGASYDKFDPSNKVAHNDVTRWTLFAIAPLQDGMSFNATFSHTTSERYNCQVQWTGTAGTAALCPTWAVTLPDTKADSLSMSVSWAF